MHYILQRDKREFYYLRDAANDRLLFALKSDEFNRYADVAGLYNSEPDDIPPAYTVEVIPLKEIGMEVYSMESEKTCRYPMSMLHPALTCQLPTLTA